MKLRVIVALLSAALITMVFALGSGAGSGPCVVDTDGDGVCDANGSDNCIDVANAGQRDDDEDQKGFDCVQIQDGDGTMWNVSGAGIIGQFSGIPEGNEVCVNFGGREPLGRGRELKKFEVHYRRV